MKISLLRNEKMNLPYSKAVVLKPWFNI